MNPLEITPAKAEAMNKLEDSALKILQEYFDGKRQGGDDVVTARNFLNTMKGTRQTSFALLGLEFNIVSYIAEGEQMNNYVKIRHPDLFKQITKTKNLQKKIAG